VKALPAAFSSDPDRLRRFLREARVLAGMKYARHQKAAGSDVRRSPPVQKYSCFGGLRGRNTPLLPLAGAEMPLVLGAWGRLCGTFPACGEVTAAEAGIAQLAQLLVPSLTRRNCHFAPVPRTPV
jgi:hypothetical protein